METMKRLQAFKFQLCPNGHQVRAMQQFSGSCCFVFNRVLALQKEHFEAGGVQQDGSMDH